MYRINQVIPKYVRVKVKGNSKVQTQKTEVIFNNEENEIWESGYNCNLKNQLDVSSIT
jgi:hypothetical protein